MQKHPRLPFAGILAETSAALAILLLPLTSVAQQSPAGQARPAAGPLAFSGVTVVDVTDGRLLADQTVVITGNRVQAVGPAGQVKVPSGARVVNAQGKYMIPGLWDMHAHTEWSGNRLALQDTMFRLNSPLYIAYGVTGIREMAQRFENPTEGADFFRAWQRDIMAATRIGPRAIGPSTDTENIPIEAPNDARRAVDSLKAAGVAFIKFHGSPDDPALYFALMREARRAGIPVVGHSPATVSNVEIADSGQLSIEHVNEHHQCWTAFSESFDSAQIAADCAPVAKAYIRNNTWIDPTLVVYKYIFDWMNRAQGPDGSAGIMAGAQEFVRLLHGLGVRNFLAGTDCAVEVLRLNGRNEKPCQRGRALLEELGLLVGAGLTPLEALQAATLNPAKYLNGTDSLGTVAAGKLADLVLLDANPLADIHSLTAEKMDGVVANGRYFDRAALDALRTESLKASDEYVQRFEAETKRKEAGEQENENTPSR